MSAKIALGEDRSSDPPCWLDEPRFANTLSRFGATYDRPDRRALVSLWSQYYLAALIIPTTVALLCHDRVLPVGADEMTVAFNTVGQVDQIWLRHAGALGTTRTDQPRFDTLVRGHLKPFVASCAAFGRMPPRVLWSNAATIFSYAVDELAGSALVAAAYAEARALLEDGGSANPLRRPFCIAHDGASTRRVCCLRHRLAGIERCADICPLDHPRARSSTRLNAEP